MTERAEMPGRRRQGSPWLSCTAAMAEGGGWAAGGIPKNTTPEEQEAARTFIQWVQSKEISVKRALEGQPRCAATSMPIRRCSPAGLYKIAGDVVASGKAFPIFTCSAQYEDVLGAQLSCLAAGGQATTAAALKAARRPAAAALDK